MTMIMIITLTMAIAMDMFMVMSKFLTMAMAPMTEDLPIPIIRFFHIYPFLDLFLRKGKVEKSTYVHLTMK